MKKIISGLFLLLFLLQGLVLPVKATEDAPFQPTPCETYSDPFDQFNLERWDEVLLYSQTRGNVLVEDGELVLRAPDTAPVEIQVYSLFTFTGDFDIQIDYAVPDPDSLQYCRFNSGLVLQTLDDQQTYKCYVAATPGEGLIFRSRLDRFGEENLEKHKGEPAPRRGALRVTRSDGKILFRALTADGWQSVYAFEKPNQEKLRIRLKLQTGDEEDERQACRFQVRFDNFKVNTCNTITSE